MTGPDLGAIAAQSDVWDRIDAVLATGDDVSLPDLVRIAGLDPSSAFRGCDLRGLPLAGQDVRGFDFTGTDLRSTGIERAHMDETTVLDGALLDRVRARTPRQTEQPSPPVRARPAPPEGGYTKVRVPDLTDAELLERTFVVDDPASLENLTAGAPPTDQWLTYEGRYDVGGRVTCAFGHRHKRGYVFRDEGERRFLFGHECGAKHLGLGRWQSFAAGRERLEERASYLRLIRDLAATFRAEREWISRLPTDPAIVAADHVRAQLRSACPTAVAAAQAAFARAGGAISVKVTVRDHAAEERRREREAKDRERYAALDESSRLAFHEKGGRAPTIDRTQLNRQEARALGTLRGRTLFGTAPALRNGLANQIGLVDAFLAIRVSPRSRQDLMGIARNAKELVSRLHRLRDAISDTIDFFEVDNLTRFAEWADRNSFDDRRFFARADCLTVERFDGGAIEAIQRPPQLRPFDSGPLERLQATVRGVSDRIERARRRREGRDAALKADTSEADDRG